MPEEVGVHADEKRGVSWVFVKTMLIGMEPEPGLDVAWESMLLIEPIELIWWWSMLVYRGDEREKKQMNDIKVSQGPARTR